MNREILKWLVTGRRPPIRFQPIWRCLVVPEALRPPPEQDHLLDGK